MRLFVVLIVSLFSTLAVAGDTKPFQVDEVLAQQQQIRTDVVAGKGRYANMPNQKRSELMAKQDELMILLEGKQSSTELSQDQYVEAFNKLEWIEATVNNVDSERMICTREKTLGSNRTTRVCRTAAQLEEQREYARQQLETGNTQLTR
ncbi:MAG: hypothetical protein H7Y19_08480 [Luteimonas sp.]|nr:hypothetical protein [Luteimonas sp.]